MRKKIKTHKKKSFKKKSKKNNIDGKLKDNILNHPYFNIGFAIGSGSLEKENKRKCCDEVKQGNEIIDEILSILDSVKDSVK